MKAAILYNKLFDHNGQKQLIGGVETYLLNLATLCSDIGMDTTVYQWANSPFEKRIEHTRVVGVPVCHLAAKAARWTCFRMVMKEIEESKDLLIFGADHVSVPTRNSRHISVQHGVSWDLPVNYLTTRRMAKYEWAARIKKRRCVQSALRFFDNCPNTVCVDYNFLNWYRTIVADEPRKRIWVIPNCAAIAAQEDRDGRDRRGEEVRILFARRFVRMRGTRLFAEAVKTVLDCYEGVSVTFAGEGGDESWLRQRFAGDPRVCFIRYLPSEAMHVHCRHDIAVVPSVASEGTSLSVAEAMGAGCAVLATAIGGVTNMIINGYNGLLVRPDVGALRKGLECLVQNATLRCELGSKAHETARAAFSIHAWRAAWRGVIEEVVA